MKKTIGTLTLLTSLFSFSAMASFSLDAESNAIKCTGKDLSVTLTANKGTLLLLTPGDDGHPDAFKVIDRKTDGDTFVSYVAQDRSGNSVTLTFADKGAYAKNLGDVIEYEQGALISIRCQKL